MKKLLYFLIFTLTILCSQANAKIWRVNNNTGVNANFTTLQTAHDGASAGDTLHLEASATAYGSLTAIKKITIIGPGYFLDENANTQALQQTAKSGSLDFQTGSEGSVVMGIEILNTVIYVRANNITIKRNKFSFDAGVSNIDYYVSIIYLYNDYQTGKPITNILISQNYGCYISDQAGSHTGVLITNNYLKTQYNSDPTTSLCLSLGANTEAIIKNNVFNGKVTVNISNVSNNIMNAGTFEGQGNLVTNNLGNSTQFGTANGNKQNIDMATVFVGFQQAASHDGSFKLKVGSPAIGAGYGSTQANPVDAGMFGSTTPYVLSGLPPVPAVYFFENQPVGSNTDPIDVTIKVKSGN